MLMLLLARWKRKISYTVKMFYFRDSRRDSPSVYSYQGTEFENILLVPGCLFINICLCSRHRATLPPILRQIQQSKYQRQRFFTRSAKFGSSDRETRYIGLWFNLVFRWEFSKLYWRALPVYRQLRPMFSQDNMILCAHRLLDHWNLVKLTICKQFVLVIGKVFPSSKIDQHQHHKNPESFICIRLMATLVVTVSITTWKVSLLTWCKMNKLVKSMITGIYTMTVYFHHPRVKYIFEYIFE